MRWCWIRWRSPRSHWSGGARRSRHRPREVGGGRVTFVLDGRGGLLATVFGLGAPVLSRLFTSDRAVLDAIGVPWWFMVAQLPIAGIVFALDGVLLGR